MIKPIILVKICNKLLYVIWLHLPVCNAASDWPRTLYTPSVFATFCLKGDVCIVHIYEGL